VQRQKELLHRVTDTAADYSMCSHKLHCLFKGLCILFTLNAASTQLSKRKAKKVRALQSLCKCLCVQLLIRETMLR